MNTTTTEDQALSLVYELNDKTIENGHSGPLRFESSGFSSAVTLYGEIVWDTEENQSPYDDTGDEQLPLRDYFLSRMAFIKEQIMEDIDTMLRTEPVATDGTPPAAPATQNAP